MSFSDALSYGFPQGMWIFLVMCLILSAVGFYKYVYFLSIGYGFAIAGMGVSFIVLFPKLITPATVMLSVMLIIYGVRLSGFLIYREVKNKTYNKILKERTKTIPLFLMVFIWIGCSLLYVGQSSPVYYRILNDNTETELLPWISILVMLIGLLIESVADLQKSSQKKENAKLPAMKGLYRIVRCPNYFGEIIFWTGVFVSGCDSYIGAAQWLVAGLSYVVIVYIMFNGAKRLESIQNNNYGELKEYKEYVNKTPIIIPLIPLYHLAKDIDK